MNRSADKDNVLMSFRGAYSPSGITPEPDSVDLNVDLREGESMDPIYTHHSTDVELEHLKNMVQRSPQLNRIGVRRGAIIGNADLLNDMSASSFVDHTNQMWVILTSAEAAETVRYPASEVLAQSPLAQKMARGWSGYTYAKPLTNLDYILACSSPKGRIISDEFKENLERHVKEFSNEIRSAQSAGSIYDDFIESINHFKAYYLPEDKTANDAVYPKEDEVKIRPLSEATTQRKRRPVMRAASIGAGDKEASMNVVMGAARRVMRQHDKELEALAKK